MATVLHPKTKRNLQWQQPRPHVEEPTFHSSHHHMNGKDLSQRNQLVVHTKTAKRLGNPCPWPLPLQNENTEHDPYSVSVNHRNSLHFPYSIETHSEWRHSMHQYLKRQRKQEGGRREEGSEEKVNFGTNGAVITFGNSLEINPDPRTEVEPYSPSPQTLTALISCLT